MARAKQKKVYNDEGLRLFGQEFLDAEAKVFKKLPKKYHAGVKDLLNKLQIWDMQVFINIAAEFKRPAPETDNDYAKGM